LAFPLNFDQRHSARVYFARFPENPEIRLCG
jgi:hypothetical protein